MKIIDNVYIVPGVTANSYILADPDGLTVIDTGLPYSEKMTLEYITGLGWSAGDIKRILITHADLDHYGCLAALQNASGARTYASQIEAEAMAIGQSSRQVNSTGTSLRRTLIAFTSTLQQAPPFRVHEILAEGHALPVLGGLQVVETPGHSPNHVSFFAPSTGILFCGDSMHSDGQGLHGRPARNNWDQDQAIASIRKQAVLGPQIVCPGHGPVVREAAGKLPV